MRTKLDDWKAIKRKSPAFFYLSCFIFILYLAQLVLKIEITPLGYFSLYSHGAVEEPSYKMHLPSGPDSLPLNIYEARGTAFLPLEIFPERYRVLKQTLNANQMDAKLKKMGIHTKQSGQNDFNNLSKFKFWYPLYLNRLGFDTQQVKVREFGFKKGEIVYINDLKE